MYIILSSHSIERGCQLSCGYPSPLSFFHIICFPYFIQLSSTHPIFYYAFLFLTFSFNFPLPTFSLSLHHLYIYIYTTRLPHSHPQQSNPRTHLYSLKSTKIIFNLVLLIWATIFLVPY